MAKYQAIEYQGPKREYTPPTGRSDILPTNAFATSILGTGYHDLDYLKEVLDLIIKNALQIYNEAESQLQSFALVVSSVDPNLTAAHKAAFPEDTTPDYVSFDEYKYILTTVDSTAGQYVINAYETAARSAGGTNALDISKLTLMTSNEAKRIKEFIDGYIGDLDDTSEYRTVELFQDWAEVASSYLQRLWTALKGTVSLRLGESELAELTTETAPQFQALFQVKLNGVNSLISDQFAMLDKSWDKSSSYFYNSIIGPALVYQLKVARHILGALDSTKAPVLANEAAGTSTGLDANFSNALADQLKRNQMYANYTTQILRNIGQRDTYQMYMTQLSQQGKTITNQFTSTSSVQQPSTITSATHPLEYDDQVNAYPTNFDVSHNLLGDTESDDAHPQYLLKSGGVLTGAIQFAAGASIDGIVPHLHAHNGSDGSPRISGNDIEYGTITPDNVDTSNASTSIPTDLQITGQVATTSGAGVVSVTVRMSFEMENIGVAGYEFEVVEIT